MYAEGSQGVTRLIIRWKTADFQRIYSEKSIVRKIGFTVDARKCSSFQRRVRLFDIGFWSLHSKLPILPVKNVDGLYYILNFGKITCSCRDLAGSYEYIWFWRILILKSLQYCMLYQYVHATDKLNLLDYSFILYVTCFHIFFYEYHKM